MPLSIRAAMKRALFLVVLVVACGTSEPAASSSPSASPKSSPTPSASRTTPLARGYSSMVDGFDSTGVLLFGGFGGPGDNWQPDLWSYTKTARWTLQSPPAADVQPGDGFSYTTKSKQPVFLDASGTNWAFNTATKRWEMRSQRTGPRAHGNHMVYDTQSDRFVVYAGEEGGWDTSAYDAGADKWTTMAPKTHPETKAWYAAAYNSKVDRIVLFGGQVLGGITNQTWTYDLEHDVWSQLHPRSSPPAREYTAMVYDPVGDRLLMFGGAGPSEEPLADFWAYSFKTNAWTEIKPKGDRPTARAWHAMAFDHVTGAAVLFGGGPSRDKYTAEVWLFDSHTNTWARG